MIALLLALAAARDEVTDLIAKLRAAGSLTAQYQVVNKLEDAVKPQHLGVLLREIEAGPAAIRPHLIRGIAAISGADVLPALRELARKHDLAARAEAAYRLTTYDDDLGYKVLGELLPKAQTDEEKRTVLSHLTGFSGEGAEAVAALGVFLGVEKKDALRRLAVQALASFRRDPGVLPVLKKIMADAADPQRLDAMAELVRRGDDEGLEQALKTLEDAVAGPQAASTLLNAIERSNKKAALPRLRDLLEKSPDKVLRTSVIRALTEMKDDKALGTLVKLSEDKDEMVSRAATEAIIKLAGKAQLDLLKKASAEGEGPRRLEAAEALLQLDRPEGFEGIKAELESGKSYNRPRAVQILQNARRKESVDILITLLEDPDAALRKQAHTAVLAVLETLFPYSRFDAKAPPEKIKAWWTKNRPK